MKISDSSGFLDEQSASLPGRAALSSADFLLTSSLSFRAASLARLAALPGDYRVLPGHMEPSTLDRERRYNPYMQMALREQG